jgi:hypothetical protein
LLIIGISSGSYSKITYSSVVHKHKFINTINIDIAIYNLQHTHALYAYQVQLFSIHKIT